MKNEKQREETLVEAAEKIINGGKTMKQTTPPNYYIILKQNKQGAQMFHNCTYYSISYPFIVNLHPRFLGMSFSGAPYAVKISFTTGKLPT